MSVTGYCFISWLFLTKFAKGWIKQHLCEDTWLSWKFKLNCNRKVLFCGLEKPVFRDLVWANRFVHLEQFSVIIALIINNKNKLHTPTVSFLSNQKNNTARIWELRSTHLFRYPVKPLIVRCPCWCSPIKTKGNIPQMDLLWNVFRKFHLCAAWIALGWCCRLSPAAVHGSLLQLPRRAQPGLLEMTQLCHARNGQEHASHRSSRSKPLTSLQLLEWRKKRGNTTKTLS